MLSDLGRNLFSSLLTELLVIILTILVKDDKRKIIILSVGTLVAGIVGFWPQTTPINTPNVIATPITASISTSSGLAPSLTQKLEPQFDQNNAEGFIRWYFHEVWNTRNYDYLWDYLSDEFRQRLDQTLFDYKTNWSKVKSIEEPITIKYEGKDGTLLKYSVQYTTLSEKSGFTDHRKDIYWLYFNPIKGHWEFK